MNKQKGLAPILIVLLITAVVGGYLIYQKQFKPVTVPQVAVKPSPTPVSTAIATSSAEAANWKTYTNYGISFEYPASWKVKEYPLNSDKGIKAYDLLALYPVENLRNMPITLRYYNPGKLSLTEFALKLKEISDNSPMRDIAGIWFALDKGQKVKMVNGIDAYFEKESYCVTTCQRYVWQYKNRIFVLTNFPIGNNKNDQKVIFDHVFSTFKFSDENVEGKFCGGIAANLPENQCPSGYRCQLDGKYPDAGGKCIKQ